LDRRRFLKYIGVGAIGVGAVASGYYLYNTGLGAKPEVTTATHAERGIPSTAQSLPELRVSYVPDENASLQDLVFLDGKLFEFSASITGAVEPLTLAWYLDDYVNPISTQYRPDPIALSPGEHYVKLVVIDGVGRRKEIRLPKVVKVGEPLIPPGKYGVAEHLRWSVPEYEIPDVVRQIAEAGVQFVRMDFNWDMVEQAKGEFYFDPFDYIVEELRARNIQVLAIPCSSARWSSSGSGSDFNVHPPRMGGAE
jgi:hypothetical protein